MAHTHPYHAHDRGCHREACDDRVDQWLAIRRRKARIAAEGQERPSQGISAHERCIIEHESGGNPQAVSGIYEGIGQWEESRWLEDGGGRYAQTPLGATYAQQEAILRGEGEAGMSQQQGQYDGCG